MNMTWRNENALAIGQESITPLRVCAQHCTSTAVSFNIHTTQWRRCSQDSNRSASLDMQESQTVVQKSLRCPVARRKEGRCE